jgi:hypothetical protein
MDTWGRLWMTLALACNFYFIINITILVEGVRRMGMHAYGRVHKGMRAYDYMGVWDCVHP